MSAFIVEQFGGIAPKLDPRRVPPPIAQIARNCLLTAGALEPLPATSAAQDMISANAVSIYPYNGGWLAYTTPHDITKAPIANDVLERLVITDAATFPKVFSAGTTYRLGLPAPASAPSAVPVTPPANPNAIDAETVSYVVTLVDAWGAEGPPSPPSVSVDRTRDTNVTVTLPATPVGNYNFGAGALKRIYRSNTGSTGGQYQFAGEVTIASNSFVDTVANADLGEILPSQTWVAPPDDNATLYPAGPLVGITSLPNGILAGFSGKTLCFSEPYLYHAWPFEYRITFDEVIVGIADVAAGLLVVTERMPYMVTGVSPAAMVVQRLEINQACVSKGGVVDMGDYAIYPTPDGLVAVSGGRAEVITREIFTREQWQAYSPETIHAYEHEGRYVAFYGNTAGFIFDPQGGANSFVNIDGYMKAAHYDALTDTLYVNDAGAVRRWEQNFAAPVPYQWKSRKHVSQKPNCFSLVRVQAWESLATNPVTVKVWADGDLKATLVLDDSDLPFTRLPSGFVAKVWELELTGTNPISHAGLFDSFVDAV